MTTHALIYRRPSRWSIARALGAAVLIHLSAVAIAFHREAASTDAAPAAVYVPFGFDPVEDPPIPPAPDMSLRRLNVAAFDEIIGRRWSVVG